MTTILPSPRTHRLLRQHSRARQCPHRTPPTPAPYLVESRGLYHGHDAARAQARLRRGSFAGHAACEPDPNGSRAPGRQYRTCGRPDSARRQSRRGPFPRAAEPHPRHRPGRQRARGRCGCILADIQKAADDGRPAFSLSLGSEGSARIGGNLSPCRRHCPCLSYAICASFAWAGRSCFRPGRSERAQTPQEGQYGYDLRSFIVPRETLGVITGAVLSSSRNRGATSGLCRPQKRRGRTDGFQIGHEPLRARP